MLYHALPVPDRHQTQLAYKLKYFPRRALNPNACKFIWHTTHITYTKASLLEHLNSERTKLYFRGQEVPIVWEYNNIPTVREWDKYPDTNFIAVEYRRTALVEGKYVAILSFSTRPNTH